MDQLWKKKHYKQLCYPKSGHMLTLPYQAIPNCEEYGGVLEQGVPATMDAWTETVKYMKEHL